MARQKPRQTTGDRATPNRQQSEPRLATPATAAREIADRIDHLCHDVVESFQSDKADERRSRLDRIGIEIRVGMLPVIGWLERRRPPGTVEVVKHRMEFVLSEASQCAGLDIPEYAGGIIARHTGQPSGSAERNATLVVPVRLFAASLREWAGEIEAEDMRRLDPSPPASRSRIPPAKRTRPMTLREAARFMGYGSSRDAAERLRAAIAAGSVQCESLTRQQHVFHLDDFPSEKWPNVKA
jgi:hypothetical protein